MNARIRKTGSACGTGLAGSSDLAVGYDACGMKWIIEEALIRGKILEFSFP